jgi:hypothetical protein
MPLGFQEPEAFHLNFPYFQTTGRDVPAREHQLVEVRLDGERRPLQQPVEDVHLLRGIPRLLEGWRL